MKDILKKILGTALVVVFFVSCASEPEAEVTSEVSDTQEDVSIISKDDMIAAKTDAETAWEAALQVKAPKAAPELFDKGEELKASAELFEAESDWAQAEKLYRESIVVYEESSEEALRVKAEAIAAMEAADKAISQVQTNADAALEEAEEEEE